jgi:hypothetical protein
LKGLVEEIGEMKIKLILGAKPIKKRPYKLAHKYKLILQKEIEEILQASIIYPIDKAEWARPMVVQPKKHDTKRVKICVDFRGLNKLTMTDMFPNSFIDEIINEVIGHECYSFTHRFSGYNKALIEKKDQPRRTLVSEFKSFSY